MAFRVSLAAQADLEEIWIYISEESGSVAIANEWLDAVGERFQLLSDWPFGRARDELRAGLRSHPVGD